MRREWKRRPATVQVSSWAGSDPSIWLASTDEMHDLQRVAGCEPGFGVAGAGDDFGVALDGDLAGFEAERGEERGDGEGRVERAAFAVEGEGERGGHGAEYEG